MSGYQGKKNIPRITVSFFGGREGAGGGGVSFRRWAGSGRVRFRRRRPCASASSAAEISQLGAGKAAADRAAVLCVLLDAFFYLFFFFFFFFCGTKPFGTEPAHRQRAEAEYLRVISQHLAHRAATGTLRGLLFFSFLFFPFSW